MKKTRLFFFISTFIFACEKDDICTQNPLTPNLILRFYDADNPSKVKDVTSLYVWAENKDTLTDYKNVTYCNPSK